MKQFIALITLLGIGFAIAFILCLAWLSRLLCRVLPIQSPTFPKSEFSEHQKVVDIDQKVVNAPEPKMPDVNFAAKSLYHRNVYNITELLERIYLKGEASPKEIEHYWRGIENFTRAMVLIKRTLPRSERSKFTLPWVVRTEGKA